MLLKLRKAIFKGTGGVASIIMVATERSRFQYECSYNGLVIVKYVCVCVGAYQRVLI